MDKTREGVIFTASVLKDVKATADASTLHKSGEEEDFPANESSRYGVKKGFEVHFAIIGPTFLELDFVNVDIAVLKRCSYIHIQKDGPIN